MLRITPRCCYQPTRMPNWAQLTPAATVDRGDTTPGSTTLDIVELSMAWSWGAQPASASMTYTGQFTNPADSINTAAAFVAPAGAYAELVINSGTSEVHRFYGVVMSDQGVDAAQGKDRVLQFHDLREFLTSLARIRAAATLEASSSASASAGSSSSSSSTIAGGAGTATTAASSVTAASSSTSSSSGAPAAAAAAPTASSAGSASWRATLRLIFDIYDTDGSGYLSPNELVTMLVTTGLQMLTQAGGGVDGRDGDASPAVGGAGAGFSAGEGVGGGGAIVDEGRAEAIANIFGRMDANKDGKGA